MRRSLVLLLTAVGGSASYGAGVATVDREPGGSDPATWRWHVSTIIEQQQRPEQSIGDLISQARFEQRYERFSTLGVPSRRMQSTP